ncbi:MAG: M36 family metallopeptidase, partial [Planctomycetota bacterium]|nr:M36 family metallopeptidase [Planctomycetota bacterium]
MRRDKRTASRRRQSRFSFWARKDRRSRRNAIHSAVEHLEDRSLLSGFTEPQYRYLPAQTFDQNEVGFLSDPDSNGPLDVATQYLRENAAEFGLSTADLSFVVTSQYESQHNGVTHIYMQQMLNGLPIANATASVNVTQFGEVINVGSSFLGGLEGIALRTPAADGPVLSAQEALASFATEAGWTLSDATIAESSTGAGQVTVLLAPEISNEPIVARLQYVPVSARTIDLAWNLNIQTIDGQHWYDANVDSADGDVTFVADWVDDASYHVYAQPLENPNDGPRTVVVDPQDPVAAEFGWHDTDGATGAEFTTTQGNAVHAYADRNNDNLPDAGSSPDGGAGLDFDFALDLTQQPDQYIPAAVTNLFYWNNIIHDVHYRYGFDEASGNFQATNYTGDGLGGDFVLAEAQDGATVGNRNNANMATPPDGTNPRMQMYLWSLSTPERDGDVDNGIIVHEYGHGVSNRLTGGPANSSALNALQSGGMGEGWSDWHALMFTQIAADNANDARGIGTYALNEPPTGPGIRSLPYTYDFAINDHTYEDITGSFSVHFIGETWATTLWDLNWALINGNALDPALPTTGLGFDADLANGTGGNNIAMQLVMDGMKLQPANPTFLDARDAILAADLILTGGAYERTIWTVFARRGMGYSADDGGDANSTDVTNAFDLPPLRISISASATTVSEAATTPIQMTIARNVSPAELAKPLDFVITNNDPTELLVPAMVTIPANQLSVTFDATPVDDTSLDGDQIVHIEATSPDDTVISIDITVLDYETLTLTIDTDSVKEDAGTGIATVTVERSNDLFEVAPNLMVTQSDTLYEYSPIGTLVTSDSILFPGISRLTEADHRLFAAPIGSFIYELDPSSGGIINAFQAPGSLGRNTGLAFDGVDVWLYDDVASRLYSLDAELGTIKTNTLLPVNAGRLSLAYLNGLLYFLDRTADEIEVFDPKLGLFRPNLRLGAVNPVAPNFGTVFVGISGAKDPDRIVLTYYETSSVMEIDPKTGEITNQFTVGSAPFGGGAVVNDQIYLGYRISPNIDVYTRGGDFVKQITTPLPFFDAMGGDDFGVISLTEYARDVVTLGNGQFVVYDGTEVGYANSFDRNARLWQPAQVAGLGTQETPVGGAIAAIGNRVFLSDMDTDAGSERGIAYIDYVNGVAQTPVRFGLARDVIDINYGLDGFLPTL